MFKHKGLCPFENLLRITCLQLTNGALLFPQKPRGQQMMLKGFGRPS